MKIELTYKHHEDDKVYNFFSTSIEEIDLVYTALRDTALFYGFQIIQHNDDGIMIINNLKA